MNIFLYTNILILLEMYFQKKLPHVIPLLNYLQSDRGGADAQLSTLPL
jgi:hypothetical protein